MTSSSTTAPSLTIAPLPTSIRLPIVQLVQDRSVADNNVVSNVEWPTVRVVIAGMRDVQDRIVLNVRPVAYFDRMHVAADYRTRPNRNVVAERHITNHGRRGINVKTREPNFRCNSLIRSYGGIHQYIVPILVERKAGDGRASDRAHQHACSTCEQAAIAKPDSSAQSRRG